jgi:hypothetical protein
MSNPVQTWAGSPTNTTTVTSGESAQFSTTKVSRARQLGGRIRKL